MKSDVSHLVFAVALALSEVALAAVISPDAAHQAWSRRHEGIPSVAVSEKNGRMWCTWYGGPTPGEDSNNYVILATSADGGKSWKEVLVSDPDGEGPLRAFDPEIWMAPDGKLRWTWTERVAPLAAASKDRYAGCAASAKDDRLMMLELNAEEEPDVARLAVPRQIARGVMMCKPTVRRDGTWLFPVAHWYEAPSACVYATSDAGKTFVELGGVTLPKDRRTYDEHQLVELGDGTLRAYVRVLKKAPDGNGLWEAESTDGGKTWGAARPSTLRHTSSRVFVTRLKSGNLLAVKNDSPGSAAGRVNMSACLSTDEGLSWPHSIALDPKRKGTSYPDGQQLSDGRLFVVYDRDRLQAREILAALFGEDDVRSGRLVTPGAKLMMRVHRGAEAQPAQPADPRAATQFKGLHAGAVQPREHVAGFLWLEAEHFATYGDWEIDTQFTHKMGSAYLICPGLGTPRAAAARTTVKIPRTGVWHVWARTKDWVPAHSPGRFAVELAGRRSSVLGASGRSGWRWERALSCDMPAGSAELRLVDLSGAFARCDAVLLTQDAAYVPPEDEAALAETRLRLSGRDADVADGGSYDFVVVGAGAGGMGAAVSAARSGARVALVYDRPVPGGNGSREMGIGLDGAQMSCKGSREAGLAEEFRLRAARHDNVLGFAYEEVLAEMRASIAAFPNERVMRVEKEGRRIVAVLARNTLTGRWTRYRAKLFADATGDGWVAQFAGARTMYGREDRAAFGEDWTVETADRLTMSGTVMGGCMGMRLRPLAAGETFVPYRAPDWAKVLPRPFWRPQKRPGSDWWLENPGRLDDLDDPEEARDNLIRIAFDYWDWQCNEWERKELARGFALDHVPYHNARREGMRVVGDYILTGNDCVSEKVFPDAVATGGWSCDVHDPLGMENPRSDGWNLVHKGGPGPYTVPYRMLYAADVDNLFLSSRCFSMTHVALGSMRVGGTIMSAAQAVGTAAAFCLKRGLMPRAYGQRHLDELRNRLFRDDLNIQWLPDRDPANLALVATASDAGLNDGIGVPEWNRQQVANYHGWRSEEKTATLEWARPVRLSEVRLAFDTGLKTRRVVLPMPPELVRDYTLDVRTDGGWKTVAAVRDNALRHRIHVFGPQTADAVRVTVGRTWGDPLSRILEIRAYGPDDSTPQTAGVVAATR